MDPEQIPAGISDGFLGWQRDSQGSSGIPGLAAQKIGFAGVCLSGSPKIDFPVIFEKVRKSTKKSHFYRPLFVFFALRRQKNDRFSQGPFLATGVYVAFAVGGIAGLKNLG